MGRSNAGGTPIVQTTKGPYSRRGYRYIESEVYVWSPPVQQKKKGIFISQDKYVHEILRKFNYTDVKSASTLTNLEKPLVQDGDVAAVDEHLYRSIDRIFVCTVQTSRGARYHVCVCECAMVSAFLPKTSHLLAVKRIFRYLKGKPSLGLWYSKDSPLELVAYTD
ncbi:hypothetical protein Tco_0701861 [Tanacetum coccineum]|uniref:Reverse transcriptase Ty1/copia-type domain-containing protein n=1 Tax=Tanacetum coccineum TaxID=301880 RepID=A0ABQ4XVF9_9ASTR